MAKKSSPWSALIGHGLAHVQNGMDFVADTGFALMKKVGKDAQAKPPKKNENKYMAGAKKAAFGTLTFLGSVGDEYYKKYEELKAEKREEK